jgi:hypothetical protein
MRLQSGTPVAIRMGDAHNRDSGSAVAENACGCDAGRKSEGRRESVFECDLHERGRWFSDSRIAAEPMRRRAVAGGPVVKAGGMLTESVKCTGDLGLIVRQNCWCGLLPRWRVG